ncbi:MAG: DUF4251 domain-containing protein [Rikenellaceae bacterium]
MKKFLLSLVMLLTFSIGANSLFAQDAKREMRRERNAAANAAADSAIAAAIKNQNFKFQATEIVYGQNPNLQNIQLNVFYYLTVMPNYFLVYLPLYGPNNFNGQPSLMHKLEFNVDSYKYNYEPTRNGGAQIVIVANDPWSINTYTFRIEANASGNWCSLSVDTPFVGPVTYNGTILTN